MDFWTFVERNKHEDVVKLRLKYHNSSHGLQFNVEAAITQIECRKKFGKKLAQTLTRNPHFYFPDVLAGEQSTSDLLAAYHASMISEGERVIDLTAGLGIDCLHIASKGADTTAIEINPLKADALRMNSGGRFEVVCADCRDFLAGSQSMKYDTAFIDPARRASDGSRVYALDQCEPDVTIMFDSIFRCFHRVLIKMSPMLDITRCSEQLSGIKRIIALGTRAECKELIAECKDADFAQGEMTIEAVTLLADGNNSTFTFHREEELQSIAKFSTPKVGDYLYEPYPAVMKAGPYRLLSARFGVDKLSPNTHLYTSPEIVKAFPGEIQEIKVVLPYSSSVIKRIKKVYPQINVAARNFDITADTIKKKLGVKDGGNMKITATRTDRPILIVSQGIVI